MVEQIMVERGIVSKRSLSKEFDKKFRDLASRVFGLGVRVREHYFHESVNQTTFAYFDGWELIKRNPLVFYSKILADVFLNRGPAESMIMTPKRINEGLGYTPKGKLLMFRLDYELKLYRPKELFLYDESLIDKTKDFIEEYKSTFDEELPMHIRF